MSCSAGTLDRFTDKSWTKDEMFRFQRLCWATISWVTRARPCRIVFLHLLGQQGIRIRAGVCGWGDQGTLIREVSEPPI